MKVKIKINAVSSHLSGWLDLRVIWKKSLTIYNSGVDRHFCKIKVLAYSG